MPMLSANSWRLLLGFAACLIIVARADAGPEVCGTGGGPTVCVRFDNRPETPFVGTDYAFDFSVPSAPSVELRVGEAAGNIRYQWRVWSKDAQGAPANIGSITSPGAYDYSVKIANPTDGPGAANLSSASLTPPGDHYAFLEDGSRISGDLTGNFIAQHATLSIDGAVGGQVFIPGASTGLTFGSVNGSVQVGTLLGAITINEALSGTLAIAAI